MDPGGDSSTKTDEATKQHVRKSLDSSRQSFSVGPSGGASVGEDGSRDQNDEELWMSWGTVVNQWESFWKKKKSLIRVKIYSQCQSSYISM